MEEIKLEHKIVKITTVTKFGNSAHILLPKKYIGKELIVIKRLENVEDTHSN